MGKQFYIDRKFRSDSLALIETMNEIIDEYVEQGYRLTVRQLYYQMVARGHIENTERNYGRICSTVNDAKLAGLMDWEAIEDRTREFIRRQRWDSPNEILKASANGFHMDMWVGQKHRVFVIVEKEALAGVLEGPCRELDVPLLAARGYPSGTVLREFAESDLLPCFADSEGKKLEKVKQQSPIIIHLGDHDPSGIDMSRDLSERLYLFCTRRVGDLGGLFQRIALNMPQIEEQRPPENPAKVTDSRFEGYQQRFGDKSWELDALKPDYLAGLVRSTTQRFIDQKAWNARAAEIKDIRRRLLEVAESFK